MMLALLDIYGKRYDLATDADLDGVPDVSQAPESQPAST
jgi:hypothetical protein